MRYISEREYQDALKVVNDFKRYNNEMGEAISELIRTIFEFELNKYPNKFIYVGNTIIFVAYTKTLITGEYTFETNEIYNEYLGQLIAIRKALGKKVDDLLDLIQVKEVVEDEYDEYMEFLKTLPDFEQQ